MTHHGFDHLYQWVNRDNRWAEAAVSIADQEERNARREKWSIAGDEDDMIFEQCIEYFSNSG